MVYNGLFLFKDYLYYIENINMRKLGLEFLLRRKLIERLVV